MLMTIVTSAYGVVADRPVLAAICGALWPLALGAIAVKTLGLWRRRK